MKLLLVYPPFCTPTVMPYSISSLKNFISNNLDIEAKCLDLNAAFHKKRFAKYYDKLASVKDNPREYASLLDDFQKESRPVYSTNHSDIINGKLPELFDEMISLILDEKADHVAFSLVYNSQCFYAYSLISELNKRGIKCIIGGPSVNAKLESKAFACNNEFELAEYLIKEGAQKKFDSEFHCDIIPDFSDYNDEDYLTKEIIIPLKSCSCCYYRQCVFCTHHKSGHYMEYGLENIRKTIVNTKKKHFFFIDDMISKKRLLELAKVLKLLKVKWWCQLRPTIDLKGTFNELHSSGLSCIAWGIESGNQRILDAIKKGTNVSDVKDILRQSHEAGIKNVAYIMFGFPSESKDEFMETINFLKENKEQIDLVSTTIFGLQKGSKIFENALDYGIYDITEEKRTILEEKISYKVKNGLSNEDAKNLRRKYIKTIKSIDKVPRVFNYMKEQILFSQ